MGRRTMIELATLGVVEVKDGEGREIHPLLAQRKRLALLIYLVLGKPQGVHRRDSVVALFWPELDQEHARAALRQAVHFLRTQLGDGVLIGRTDEELAVSSTVLACDVRAFEAACETGRAEQAMQLYRGDFLDGFYIADVAPEFEHWVAAERGRLRVRAAQAAWALAGQCRTRGDFTAAAAWARRGANLAGDDEADVRRLIAFLDELGDRAGALHVYADFAARLRTEFDAEPTAETRALMESVRRRVAEAVPPLTRANELNRPLPIPERAPVTTAAPTRSLRAAPRRRAWVIGALGLGLVASLGTFLVLGGHRAVLAADLVAVAPFDVRGASIGPWGEGLVEYLSRTLDGAGDLQAVSPSLFLRRWSGPADPASARALGRQVGARFVVLGSLVQGGADSVRLRATLLDVANGRSLGEVEVRGDTLGIDRVADSLAIALLRELGHTRPVGAVRNLPFGRASLPAIKEFLKGEHFYRRSMYDSAVVHHARAIALDDSFALAYRRMALELGWGPANGGDFAPPDGYAFEAAALNRGLATRDSLLIAADSLYYARGYVPDSVSYPMRHRLHALLEQAARQFPGDPEVWLAMGELREHVDLFAPPSAILQAFDRAIALDSGFAPAYEHVLQQATRVGGAELARPHARAYLALNVSDANSEAIRLAAMLFDPARARSPEVERFVDTAGVETLFRVGVEHLASWADSDETAIRLLRAIPVGRRRVAGALPWIADTLMWPQWLAASLLNRGHAREASRVYRPVLAHPNRPEWARFEYPLRSLVLLNTISPDTANVLIRQSVQSGMSEPRDWLWWWWAQRDTVALAKIDRQADRSARGAYLRTAALAYLALLRGDSVAATAHLRALPDSLCEFFDCSPEKLTLARLLEARGADREAGEIIDRWLWIDTPFFVFARLERARVAERLGDRDQAIQSYRFVADAWQHADSELQSYVAEARDGLRRLGTEQRR